MLAFDTRTLQRAGIHVPEKTDPPAAFAAQELQRYLLELTGTRVGIRPHSTLRDGNVVVLGPHPAPAGASRRIESADGFVVELNESSITLAGGTPRALLHAVYALLDQLGCDWSLNGPRHEVVPRLKTPTVPLRPMVHSPAFAVRGYCADIMTWHYTQPEYLSEHLEADRAFIDWMAKSGANTFFFIRHPFDTQLTIPELLPEFERRGIDLEYGGHVIPLLLPRQLYGEHPDYFPEAPDGARTDNGNLCTSSAAALATASTNAVRYVGEHPEMRVMHVWGADLWHGGWCRCAACRSVGVQDQSLRVCNAVARGLEFAGVPRPVCYLAYHDTIDADLTLQPEKNVIAEFAPRERCYGHALNDPGCDTNRRYAAALARYVDLFDGRVRLFEYYGDAILFFGCAVPLSQVIAADVEYYRQLGVREITMLQFGGFSTWAYPLNFLAFAATSAGCDPHTAADGYCGQFGAQASAVRALFAELEAIMRGVVTYGDIRRPPRSGAEAARVLAQIVAALPRLAGIVKGFEQLGDEVLQAQAALVRYTQMILASVCQELQTATRLDQAYTDALQIMEQVDRRFSGLWGCVDLPIIHGYYSAV